MSLNQCGVSIGQAWALANGPESVLIGIVIGVAWSDFNRWRKRR